MKPEQVVLAIVVAVCAIPAALGIAYLGLLAWKAVERYRLKCTLRRRARRSFDEAFDRMFDDWLDRTIEENRRGER